MAAEASKLWEREELGSDGPHSELTATLRKIRDRQQFRVTSDRLFQQLFCDLRYVGFEDTASARDLVDVMDGRLTENVVAEVIETLHAKLDKVQPRPTTDIIAGDWDLQYEGAKLNQYLEGRWAQCKADAKVSFMTLHGLIYGTGLVKTYWDSAAKAPCVDVVPPSECWVDPSEARYGEPRTFWQTKAYPREVLLDLFGGKDAAKGTEEALKSARGVLGFLEQQNWTGADTASDMVVVGEVWHLPPLGRRMLFVDNFVLENEEWKRDRFPFRAFRYGRRPFGFWGYGLPEILIGQQLEVNRTIASRQEAMRYLSAPYVLLERGAKIIRSHMSDLIGRIVEYTGLKPEVVAPEPISQSLLTHGGEVRKSMFDRSGVSMLSAASQKPAGLNSGKAIRNYLDNESERFVGIMHEKEDVTVGIAEDMLDLEHEHGGSAVLYDGPEGVEEVHFPDLKRDQYRVKVAKTSALSQSFAGKVQDLMDLRDLGAITDPEDIQEMLPLPDLKRKRDLNLSPRDVIRKVVEVMILKHGQYLEPEPFWDLVYGLEHGTAVLLRCTLLELDGKGPGPEKMQMLRTWVQACRDRMNEARDADAAAAAASAAAAAPMNGAAGPAMAAPATVSAPVA